jgi:hypothetical protein
MQYHDDEANQDRHFHEWADDGGESNTGADAEHHDRNGKLDVAGRRKRKVSVLK